MAVCARANERVRYMDDGRVRLMLAYRFERPNVGNLYLCLCQNGSESVRCTVLINKTGYFKIIISNCINTDYLNWFTYRVTELTNLLYVLMLSIG